MRTSTFPTLQELLNTKDEGYPIPQTTHFILPHTLDPKGKVSEGWDIWDSKQAEESDADPIHECSDYDALITHLQDTYPNSFK